MEVNPTAENIARLVFELVADCGLPVIEVSIWETGASYASCRP
jgi:6-pyruvoyltetrahydropterin/6-carboxytetrahydropterin synthase